MFDSILSWLGSFWTALVNIIKEVWRQIGVTLVNAWTIMLAVFGWVYWSWQKVGEALAMVGSTVDAIVFPAAAGAPGIAGPIMSKLAIVNTILPVEETFAFTLAFLQLLLALAIYRLIKSWIPTLS